MKKNKYYQPDYQQLNRKAKICSSNGIDNQPGELLSRLLPWNMKAESIREDTELLKQLSDTITEIKQAINWEQNLFSASYVVFDTETTGLNPFKGDEIISLGAVIIEGGQILSQPAFYRLVNPKRQVSAQSKKLTGLTDEMLRDKPEIGKVLLEFLRFTGPRILVAHNAPFDLAFINSKLSESISWRIVNPVIDTVLLTSALYYSIGDYSLESLSSRFKLDLEGRHHALSDARIAASLFLKLLPELKRKNVNTLHQLAQFFTDSDPSKGYPLIF